GVFKGRRFLTRYEFAVVAAKIIARVDALKIQPPPSDLTPEMQILAARLSAEFREELDKLGGRLDTMEIKVADAEEKASALEEALSNVQIRGFYSAGQTYVLRKNERTEFAEPGLHQMNQDIFLRFIGNPKLELGGFAKTVEAFLEMHGNLSGVASRRVAYSFSDQPVSGDNIDDFVTGIDDDRKVVASKAHFKSRGPLMNLRLFKGEQFTDLRDPASLLTARSWRVSPSSGLFSGVEADGKRGKWTYFTSTLKRIREVSSEGRNELNLFEEFEKTKDFEDDVFSFRLTYEPLNLELSGVKHQLQFGGTFLEHAFNYSTRDDFNRVIGWDGRYSYRGKGTFDLTLNQMLSEGRTDVQGRGFKGDAQFERGNLFLAFKGYDFDPDFKSSVSAFQYVDTERGRNYGRGSTTGEKFLRLIGKYTLDEGELAIVKKLSMTATGQVKWWEKLPGSENQPWYGREGVKLSLLTVADFQGHTTDPDNAATAHPFQVQLQNQLKKDARDDEEGAATHTLQFGMRLLPFAGITGQLQFASDFDNIVDGQHFTRNQSTLQISGHVHPHAFVSGKILDRTDWGGRANEVDVDILDFETKIDVRDNVAIKEFFRRQKVFQRAAGLEDTVTDFWVTELNVNFSSHLEARASYAWQEEQHSLSRERDFWNWFGEITYEPNSSTEVALSYGQNFRDRFDFLSTRQEIGLKAQMSF
ncbi:hypothetical protein HOF92_14780, partial [bacterium]|nr:hypothetical protein [bacterium]